LDALRIAVVSDVHGNLTALEAVVADLKTQAPDLVLQGGDLALIGPRPAEAVELVRQMGWPSVMGNTDEIVFDAANRGLELAKAPQLRPWLKTLFDDLAPWARERLSQDQIAWLRRLPRQRKLEELALVHASPDDLWRSPMPDTPDGELEGVYGVLSARLVVYGHIHRPYVRRLQRLIVANAGSVGLPYDGDPRASYLFVDGSTVTTRRVEYDLDLARTDAIQSGFPLAEWLADVQRHARFRMP